MNTATDRAHDLRKEEAYWDNTDIDLTRRVAWSSLSTFQLNPVRCVTDGRDDLIDYLQPFVSPDHHAVALACGDLTGEYPYFDRLKSSLVDAIDISEVSFKRFQERVVHPSMDVVFHKQDVNQITLKEKYYNFAICVHAFHHFEKLEYIAEQLRKALTDDGVFLVIDYIGPNRLQYSSRQLAVAEPIFQSLAPQYRRDHRGHERKQIHRTPPEMYPPYEAIRSQDIIPVFKQHFDLVSGILYAGLLYPLFEGVAFNYDESRDWDRRFIDAMWELDRSLCDLGLLEPNFCILVLKPKSQTVDSASDNSWHSVPQSQAPTSESYQSDLLQRVKKGISDIFARN